MRNFIIATITCFSFIYNAQIDPQSVSTSYKFQEIIQHIERNYVDPVNAKKLTETATSKKLLGEIKRSSQFKAAKEEVDEARAEYNRITKQLREEAKVWITNRVNELKLHEHKKYYFNAISACKTSANEVSKTLGSKHVGALLQFGSFGNRHQNPFEEFLFGKQNWWQTYRFRHPRFSMEL